VSNLLGQRQSVEIRHFDIRHDRIARCPGVECRPDMPSAAERYHRKMPPMLPSEPLAVGSLIIHKPNEGSLADTL